MSDIVDQFTISLRDIPLNDNNKIHNYYGNPEHRAKYDRLHGEQINKFVQEYAEGDFKKMMKKYKDRIKFDGDTQYRSDTIYIEKDFYNTLKKEKADELRKKLIGSGYHFTNYKDLYRSIVTNYL